RREPERFGDTLECPLGPLARDRDLPVCERAFRDVAEEDVRVGDRRLLAAAAVAGGPRRRAGRARPDLQAARGIEPSERAAARADVPLHQWADVGIHDRGRRALVLALLAQDLARERNRGTWQLLAQDGAEALLVLGVEVRMQQADRGRLDAGLAQPPGDGARL